MATIICNICGVEYTKDDQYNICPYCAMVNDDCDKDTDTEIEVYESDAFEETVDEPMSDIPSKKQHADFFDDRDIASGDCKLTPSEKCPQGKVNKYVPSMGDKVLFGRYKSNGEKGTGPVEWEIIDCKDGAYLLWATSCVATRPYHGCVKRSVSGMTENMQIWENCDLRRWLSCDFADKAFNDDEKKALVTCVSNTSVNPNFEFVDNGKPVDDIVFILSIEQIRNYRLFAKDRMRCATFTRSKKGIEIRNGKKWWVRTPGHIANTAMFVEESGKCNVAGAWVDSSDYVVRPAVWVDGRYSDLLERAD